MTRGICILVALCWGHIAVVHAQDFTVPKVHPDSRPLPGANGWQNLFAADLSDAIAVPGIWSFRDSVLAATEDQFLWTKTQYGDCVIDLEFKNSPSANSGVFVYGSDPKDWIANSVEIQILDDFAAKWAGVPNTWRCAGIFGHLAPAKSVVKKAGEWNRMTVTCKGPKIYVLLNGEMVTEMDMKKWTSLKKNPDGSDIPPWYTKTLAELPTKGHIGLQGAHGGEPTYFRNVRIKSLPSQ